MKIDNFDVYVQFYLMTEETVEQKPTFEPTAPRVVYLAYRGRNSYALFPPNS